MDVSVDKTGAYYPASDIDLLFPVKLSDTDDIAVFYGNVS